MLKISKLDLKNKQKTTDTSFKAITFSLANKSKLNIHINYLRGS